MNRFVSVTKPLTLLMALLMAALAAGCGSGSDPILGGGGAGPLLAVPAGAIIPGAVCAAASGVTIPTVTLSDPPSGNLSVATSNAGVANNGKLITATFDLAMDPLTINATTFQLAPVNGVALTPASVSYNATTKVATLTTSLPLVDNTSYTAIITVGATTLATPTPIACPYAWTFKTVTPPVTALAPVNLGLAAPFGIAATAGVVNTITAPITNINGNVVLDSNTTCNAVIIDGAGGFGLCNGMAPTINGTVISPLFPDAGITSGAIKADLSAAYLSITPPAGPPAAGSLGGATNLPAGTTLGDVAGNPMVQGDNYFVPGVYQSLTSILITGDITLDAQGNPNAVFVFQSSSTVGTAAGAASPGAHTRILLINGAKASNVWWQAGSSATLGAYTEFQGNILAAYDITMVTGATSCGRLMAGAWVAGSGAFVFDSNIVSVPGHPSAPVGCQ